MASNILNSPVEIFAENTIEEYTDDEELIVGEMIDKYLNNEGFFVLEKNGKFYGYLDLYSIREIRELNTLKDYHKKVKEIIEEKRIQFKTNHLMKRDTLRKARRLLKGKTKFIPVLNENKKTIGRISEAIINKRIEILLKHGFKLED